MHYYGATMKRTTIMLPARLKSRVEYRARSEGVSLGEFVRMALTEALRVAEAAEPSHDSLLVDPDVFDGEIPPDTSEQHDTYLYEH
jgi:hypothetical protein